ncbi:flagellar basal-body rod protein FlgB [Candidatus Gastranaerophilus sp. (ex Termes propinquus)]|nr:flagellar basal-body rod protein FlgB [Candidatus Gastranaerophilus sp. (ex Termes propinquus)]
MDLINSRTRDIAAMALDGLYERQRAHSANIANAATPGFQRTDVVFEDQLQSIREGYDLKTEIKLQNSDPNLWKKNPKEALEALKRQDPAQLAFLNSDLGKDYKPVVADGFGPSVSTDGNNVVLEEEMLKAAKTGTQYTIVATLLGKSFKGLESVIKGQPS